MIQVKNISGRRLGLDLSPKGYSLLSGQSVRLPDACGRDRLIAKYVKKNKISLTPVQIEPAEQTPAGTGGGKIKAAKKSTKKSLKKSVKKSSKKSAKSSEKKPVGKPAKTKKSKSQETGTAKSYFTPAFKNLED